MTEYKAGDKVIGITKHHEGETMTVIEKSRGGMYWRCDTGDGYTAMMLPEEIKLVKPKFKVGDKVRFLKFWTGTGTVLEVDGDIWPVRVEHPNGSIGRFHDAELELAPAHKFKVGDWVEVTGWGGSWEGQVLQIASLPIPGSIYYRLEGGGGFSDKQLKAAEAPKPSADMVNGPSHYGGADNPYEAIKVAEAWGFEKNAYLFNALKYLARAEHKGRKVEDLKKLQFYVAREIALEEAK